MSDIKKDEKDILAENARMATDLEAVRGLLATEQGSVTALTSENGKLTSDLAAARQSIGSLGTERDSLKAENTTLKAEKKTVDEAVAAKLVELGISDKGGKKEEAKEGVKLTGTQKWLQSKGMPLNTKVVIGETISIPGK